MFLRRTILAVLLSLTMAFAPIANAAMARSCAMTSEAGVSNLAQCPCHGTMPDCASMPQCATTTGCSSQCFTQSGLVPDIAGVSLLGHNIVPMGSRPVLASLVIQPPAPPPRA